jgi:hypothetical protein
MDQNLKFILSRIFHKKKRKFLDFLMLDCRVLKNVHRKVVL